MRRLLVLVITTLAIGLAAFETFPGDREFQLCTRSLSVVVRDGFIVEMRDLETEKLWADRHHNDTHIPCGLGILTDIDEFRQLHQRNGWFDYGLAIEPDFTLHNYYIPTETSKYSLLPGHNETIVSWQGLSNGQVFLPEANLKIIFSEAEEGALKIQTSGSYPGGNVFGVITPVTNLDKNGRMVLPLYGGKVFRDGPPCMLSALAKNEDMEAPLMILEDSNDSMALWMENPTMRPYHVFANRSGKSFAYIFENNTLMYFADKKEVSAPLLFLNVFTGDWKAAATPYRNWYTDCFRQEIAVRENVKWTKDIGTVLRIEKYMLKDNGLALLREFFDKDTLMMMIWNARKPGWDRELPDWTPHDKYVDEIKRAKNYGFKTMAYVNVCCANYQSPAWKKYNLDDIFLPFKVSIAYYLETDLSQEEKQNTMNFKVFEGFKDGNLYYGDLLSKKWREFHANLMKEWNTLTGTDANYEDTAGCGLDVGNGIIDGLSGSQGEMEQMRLLQKTQSHIPMASEYNTPAVAFAVTWPLKASCCWRFTDALREAMIHDFLPLSAYIYGNRPWISGSRGFNAHHWHIQTALADSLGGFGFVYEHFYQNKTKEDIENDFSFEGFLHYRSTIFSSKRLLPFFPKERYSNNIVCMYTGCDGLYSYYDNGFLQELRAPDGKALYGRVHNISRIETDSLCVINWPFQKENKIFGLNPTANYPLFPRQFQQQKTTISTNNLPDQVYVKKYFETSDVAYLELEAIPNGPEQIAIKLDSGKSYSLCYANGEKTNFGLINANLPLRLVCFTQKTDLTIPAELSVIPMAEAGYQCNKIFSFDKLSKTKFKSMDIFTLGEGRHTVVFTCQVPTSTSALEVVVVDQANIYTHPHDGTIFRVSVNGVEEVRHDTCHRDILKWITGSKRKEMFDLRPRKLTIPLGKHTGQLVLISIETDPAQSCVGDNPHLSLPRLINDLQQEHKNEILE